MARGVNKVILIGNLGQDPEVRFMPSGNAVANMSLATTEVWNDKQTGQRQERTEWHRVVLFSKLAEVAQKYLKKGSRVYVEGKLQTRKWQDQNGIDRYTTEVVINDLQMLDSMPQGGQQGGYQQQGNQAPAQQPQGGYQQQGNQAPAQQQQGGYQQQGNQAPAQQQQGGQQQGNQAPAQQQQGGQQQGGPAPGSFDDFDDEIPF